jgi:hypothetical protein
MEQIGDEEDDKDEDYSEEDEERSEAYYLRSGILGQVAHVYQDLKESNLSDDEYSKRRKFVDDLTAPFVRVAVLPDDEVEKHYTKSLAAIPHIIGDLLLDTLYEHHDNTVIDTKNRKIDIVLDWRFYYVDFLRIMLKYVIISTEVCNLSA